MLDACGISDNNGNSLNAELDDNNKSYMVEDLR